MMCAVETDEVLESGYGPGAPRGDNLLNDFVQGEAEAFAELGRARGDRIEQDDEFALTMTDGGSPTLVRQRRRAPSPAARTRVAGPRRARMHEFFAGASGWRLHDLQRLADARRARASGFGAVGHPPLMLRPPGPIPAPASATASRYAR